MRLHLPIPSEWPLREQGGGVRVVLAGDAGEAELTLEWAGVELLPDDQKAWVVRALTVDAPPARLEVVADEHTTTIAGWPVRLVEARLLGADGAVLERRLGAFYACFEHAAVALARSRSDAHLARRAPELRALLRAGAPRFTDEPAAISALWDVETPRAPAPSPGPPGPRTAPPLDLAALERDAAVLRARLDAGGGDAATRGAIGRRLGLALATLGRDAEAIAAWEAAAAADPDDVDALYDAGQAHYNRRAYAEALDCWQRAALRDVADFGVARKLVQALRALDRHDEAATATARLHALWRTSPDPAVRLLDEVVVDQFDVGGARVLAIEPLRARDPRVRPVITFRVQGAEPAPLQVRVETSEYGRERGVPYVLSLARGRRYEVVGSSVELPPYPALRATAAKLLAQALAG